MSWSTDEAVQIERMEGKLDSLLSHEKRIKSLERTRAYGLGALLVMVAGVAALRDAIIAALWGRA